VTGPIPASAAVTRRPLPLAAALLVLLGLVATTIAGAMLVVLGARTFGTDSGLGVSPGAVADIPPTYMALYEAAGQRYGVDWSILAAIGKVECDHGRDPDPSCTREGVTNSAGAGGPAQFLAATWAQYGVDADGNGVRDRWAPADAVFGMANFVRASGAPSDYPRAIFAYNHATWYVSEVLAWAARYRSAAASAGAGAGSEQVVPGARATLSPGNGHVALVPLGAPPAVQAMIAAGNRLQDLPYGPAGHPDPRGAPSEDCSSTVSYVLMAAGARTPADVVSSNPLARDYVHWGLPGPGRWVTIYATTVPTEHVFVVIAGLRLDTSHRGTDVGPNRDQDGPRWRIYDQIPGWASWAVRHPPGL
jgi:hypothetical protein